MELRIEISDDKINELVNMKAEEIGSEYFTEILKEAFTEVIANDLKTVVNLSKSLESDKSYQSFIQRLFLDAKPSGNGFDAIYKYEPSQFLKEAILSLPLEENLGKLTDDILDLMRSNMHKYICDIMIQMFVGNILETNTFKETLKIAMDETIGKTLNIIHDKGIK
jgi:hypothetical protein